MTKEEGSENLSRSPSNMQDGADETQKKPLIIRYKRNPRVLCSNDTKEEVKLSSENSGGDGDDRRISSTFIEAAQNKPEIVPFKKIPSYTTCQDDNLDPDDQSQLETRESGGKLSPFMSAGEEKITGDEDLVEGGISTKIHDGAHSKTTESTPHEGGGDYNDDTAPNVVGDGKQAHNTNHDIGGAKDDGCLPTDTSVEKSDGKEAHNTKHDIGVANGDGCLPTDISVEKSDGNSEADCHEQVQQVAMKDGVDESGFNGVPEEEGQSNRDKKPVGFFVSLMMAVGDIPDQILEFDDNGGNSSCLLTDHTTVESKHGGSGEAGDGEVQQASMADGGHANTTAGGEEQGEGGKKPMEIDMSVISHDEGSSKSSKVPKDGNAADEEQVHSVDLVTKPEEGGGKGNDIAPAVLGGDTPSSIDNTSGCILDQGQQDPNTTIYVRKRSRSTLEQGEVTQEGGGSGDGSEEQARKIFKCGSDGVSGTSNALGPNGGIGSDEPPVQQRKIRLFGFDISYELEHHVPIIIRNSGRSASNQAVGSGDGSLPMMQPMPGIRLFGVDISGDQVRPAATENNDGGSSSNRLPGSDGGHGR